MSLWSLCLGKLKENSVDYLINIAEGNLVFSRSGAVFTTSKALAILSGKSHANVLRDIRKEIDFTSRSESLTDEEKVQILSGFEESAYKDAKGELRVCYLLSEEAFLYIASKYSIGVRYKVTHAFVEFKNALMKDVQTRLLKSILEASKDSWGFVYVIQESESGNLKIGVSKNPAARLKQLQTGNSQTLKLLYTSLVCANAFELESSVHEAFAEYAIRGEWFNSELTLEDVISFLESQRFVLTPEFGLDFDSAVIGTVENT